VKAWIKEVIMAHEVESMIYVGPEPWHGLGVAVPEGAKLNIGEAIEAAGLDWEVELRHIFVEDQLGGRIGILDYYASCRKRDNAILGIVGPDYRPLQNREAFEWFQPFFKEGNAIIETAGSLKGGKKIWILARVKDNALTVRKDDEVCNYVLLSNSHDGSMPVSIGFTPIRVVCNNTLSMAHESKASKLLRVRHTLNLHINLKNIRDVMDLATREFKATTKQYRELAAKGIKAKDLENYVKKVFEIRDIKNSKTFPKVVYLFENGRGSRAAGTTYWGAYNAINEYLNYFRGKTQDSILENLWYGDGAMTNRKALRVALDMAKAAA